MIKFWNFQIIQSTGVYEHGRGEKDPPSVPNKINKIFGLTGEKQTCIISNCMHIEKNCGFQRLFQGLSFST